MEMDKADKRRTSMSTDLALKCACQLRSQKKKMQKSFHLLLITGKYICHIANAANQDQKTE